jgi:hypothetical protein
MSNNWWAAKLGQPQTRPSNIPPAPPSQQPMTPVTMPQQLDSTLPPSSQTSTKCPGCRGNNYALIGTQVTMNGSVPTYRCYDCGYPLVQAGSQHGGASSAPSSGSATPAKQVSTGGWNPTTIIGKLG